MLFSSMCLTTWIGDDRISEAKKGIYSFSDLEELHLTRYLKPNPFLKSLFVLYYSVPKTTYSSSRLMNVTS